MKATIEKKVALVDIDKLNQALWGLPATRARAILNAVILEESEIEGFLSQRACSLGR